MPVTNYIWDELSDNVLMEVDENGAEIVRYNHEPGQFGELISQRRDSVNSFHHYDAQGNTRQLTDDSQTVTDTYTYTAFGETVSESGTTTNPFRYIGAWGYYTDSETNEIYVRRRTYSPSIARWMSVDPIMFSDGFSEYAYVRNMPFSEGGTEICCMYVGEFGIRDERSVNCPGDKKADTCCEERTPIGMAYTGQWRLCDAFQKPKRVYCGELHFVCCGISYSWPVYGESDIANAIFKPDHGCVTLIWPRRIECNGACPDIKGWNSAPGVPILDHEACHACAYEESGAWVYLGTAIWDICDYTSVPATPNW